MRPARLVSSCFATLIVGWGSSGLAAQAAWDFEFSYQNVFESHADTYLVHNTNAQKVREPSNISFWTPVQTGVTAILRYHFNFPRTTAAVHLIAECSTWNYALGVGDASIWCSVDGQNWILLVDNPAPTSSIDRRIIFDQLLPPTLTGSTDIWIEYRMIRHGGSYRYGGAQCSRSDPATPAIFALRATYAAVQASYSTYRQSCPSSVGTPQLTATLPIAGQPWTITITGLRGATPTQPPPVGWLIFALDDRMLGLTPLPLDLVIIGAPGCYVNVNSDPGSGATLHLLPADASGRAVAVIPVPNVPAAIGFTFYNQYVSLDAPATRLLQITTTNAGRGVVGS